MRTYDVAVIGAGSAGLSALHEVRKQTENFVIINDGPYGTTCARVGCMPSKALIESANAFHHRRAFEAFGIRGARNLTVDVAAVLQRVRSLRDQFVAGTVRITDSLGPRSMAGRAAFVAPNVLEVNGERLRAKSIVIATGSRPIVPAKWRQFGERVLTSDTLFEQRELPPRMAVVGLGVIGVEIAQALSRLGIHIAAFGAGERIAGLRDPVVSAQAVALMRDEFTVHLGATAELTQEGAGIRVSASDHSAVVDVVFAALGRQPNIDALGFEQLGVTLDEHGMPPFNPQSLQIAGLPIYFAGDVNAAWPVLHEAADDGYISGYNALRDEPACFSRRAPLAIVFSDPNIAVVGERRAALDPAQLAIGAVDFAQQGRARMAEANRGVLRVYADKSTARLLGAELCAPRGEHLAHLLALAVHRRLTVHELLGTPFYHPVFEEGLRTALRDCSRNLAGGPASDLANCEPIGAAALD